MLQGHARRASTPPATFASEQPPVSSWYILALVGSAGFAGHLLDILGLGLDLSEAASPGAAEAMDLADALSDPDDLLLALDEARLCQLLPLLPATLLAPSRRETNVRLIGKAGAKWCDGGAPTLVRGYWDHRGLQ